MRMRPCPAARITRAAADATSTVPSTFTSSTWRKLSSVALWNICGPLIPALVMRMSRRPHSPIANSTIDAAEAGSSTAP